MNLRLLTDDERQCLKVVFDKAFESELPSATQANILAVVEDGQIIAFLTAEVLIRAGMLWVHPKKRGTAQSARMIKALARETAQSIPKGASVITIGTEYADLFKRLGMRKVEGDVYRIDL